LVGDYGFDPLSLGKSPEYLQFELDSLNQNLAKNPAGDVLGTRVDKKTSINPTPFQPYSEVFGLQRFRECELIHGRWAMLAVLGALAVETFTGVTWQDAGKVSFSFSLLSVCLSAVVVVYGLNECPHIRCSCFLRDLRCSKMTFFLVISRWCFYGSSGYVFIKFIFFLWWFAG
jgi:hypothetical protein